MLRVSTTFRRCRSGFPMASNVLRPMMTGLSIVSRLKCLRSSGKCHGRAPPRPITPPRSCATTKITRGRRTLDGDFGANRRVRLVSREDDVFVAVIEERMRTPLENERRQRQRIARQLQPRLLEMVVVQMAIAAGPNEFPGIEIALMRDHVREQCVRRNVERHAQKCVGAALVQLARETAVRNVKLEQQVTWLQRHLIEVADVPSTDDKPARIGIAADLV